MFTTADGLLHNAKVLQKNKGERALFIIDKKGIIRYIDVHDINKRPRLESIVKELKKLNK
jgi:peroxiredoxin